MSSTTTPAVTQQAFDEAYSAAQPAVVKEMMAMPWGTAKVAKAQALAAQGYVIDGTVMVWGWDPYLTTVMRQSYGYTWVPSYLQSPINLAPGLKQGSTPTYDAAVVPPGAIEVTLDVSLLPGIFAAPSLS